VEVCGESAAGIVAVIASRSTKSLSSHEDVTAAAATQFIDHGCQPAPGVVLLGRPLERPIRFGKNLHTDGRTERHEAEADAAFPRLAQQLPQAPI